MLLKIAIAILCVSYRQHSQAQNAHESECYSASGGGCVVNVIKDRAHSLGFTQLYPTPMFTDSGSTRDVSDSEAALKRSAHIRRRINVMLQAVLNGVLQFFRVKGKRNPADLLTKWASPREFFAYRKFTMGF